MDTCLSRVDNVHIVDCQGEQGNRTRCPFYEAYQSRKQKITQQGAPQQSYGYMQAPNLRPRVIYRTNTKILQYLYWYNRGQQHTVRICKAASYTSLHSAHTQNSKAKYPITEEMVNTEIAQQIAV